jgi:hypothetical protein
MGERDCGTKRYWMWRCDSQNEQVSRCVINCSPVNKLDHVVH